MDNPLTLLGLLAFGLLLLAIPFVILRKLDAIDRRLRGLEAVLRQEDVARPELPPTPAGRSCRLRR